MNRSHENWSDVQLSLSTATPSLGGALPKLATLKINFETEQFRFASRSKRSAFSLSTSFSNASASGRQISSMSARQSLSPDSRYDEESEFDGKINVLATETEASMSSTNFTIPRRSTIEADVNPSLPFFLI